MPSSISYNFFEKHFSKPLALALLQQTGLLNAPNDDTLKILDHACGMGLIASVMNEATDINRRSPPTEFICGDISPNAIRATEARIEQCGWKGVIANVIDAQVRRNDLLDVGFPKLTVNSRTASSPTTHSRTFSVALDML